MRHRFPVTATFPYFTKSTVQTDDDREMQRLLYAVKDGKSVVVEGRTMSSSEWYSQTVEPDSRDRLFLNRTVTLVPVPSSRLTPPGIGPQSWVCLDIASRLAARGFALDAKVIVRRTTAVRSSKDARSAGEQPPSVEAQRDSMAVDRSLLHNVSAITLVDDVVSAGRNSMGAYLRLRAEGFTGPITLFAVAYTNYEKGLRDPYYGHIIWYEGKETSVRANDGVVVPRPLAWEADPPTRGECAFLD